jgi:4-hydroxy-tetrahydrodipicolinate synthase
MAKYKKTEAREWARTTMHGVANVVIPTFTQDLSGLNEKAIRFDIRKEIEYGFWGTLLVAETATTPEEYLQFARWAADEAGGRLHLIHHASFNTLEQNIQVARAASEIGSELILLSYPANFYAETRDDIYRYTKAFADAVDIGIILFPVPLWGFERIHPSGIDLSLIRHLVDDVPNIVAVKAEGGMPTVAGFVETYKALADRVLVTFPLEADALPMAGLVNMQFMGTSNYEYFGPTIPRIFATIRDGNFEKAMEIYWQIHPARMANMSAMAMMIGANFLHRMLWKYQGWLSGFNGGPLRQPTMRLTDRQMKPLRAALREAGLNPTGDSDKAFFVGRNPA